jgi:ubiquinone/menaquinone biosynthesis C-methylase UbiE
MIPDLEDVFERQARRYDRPLGTWAELEKKAFGQAVGSNGYTILAEAEELAYLSEAKVAGPVLDLGTGRGWPGWLIAEHVERNLVAIDVPMAGLQHAREAFAARDLSLRTQVIAADGMALPFASETFSSVVHTDVFC